MTAYHEGSRTNVDPTVYTDKHARPATNSEQAPLVELTVDMYDWIASGMTVVLFSMGPTGTRPDIQVNQIAKVNKKTFTVARPNEPRFPIEKSPQVRQGGSWGWTRHVVAAESEHGEQLLRQRHRQIQVSRADSSYERWRRSRTDEDLRMLIAWLEDLVEQDD